MRKHLSFANVVSCLALFLALSAGAYAATSLPANSVGSKQIKAKAVTKSKLAAGSVGATQLHAGAVTASKLANGAVTGAKVVRGSLTGADINLTTLGQVPAAAFAQAADVARLVTVQVAATAVANAPAATSASAVCPAGLDVVGGGASLSDEANEFINDTFPSGTNTWTVHVFAGSNGGTAFTVYAICAPAAATS